MPSGTEIVGIVMLGAPGSGKGTQLALLREKLDGRCGFVAMSEALKSAEAHKEEIDSYIAEGALVPDNIVNAVLKEEVDRVFTPGLEGVFFDGFPRNTQQAVFLDDFVKIELVLFLSIADDAIISRLSSRLVCNECYKVFGVQDAPGKRVVQVGDSCIECGKGSIYRRQDDDGAIIRNRIAIHRKEESDLLDFYRQKVVEINAEADIHCISAAVESALNAIGIFV